MKELVIKFILVLFSILFCFLVLEIILRVLPQKYSKIDNSILSDLRIYSSTRLSKFKPNHSRVWTGLGQPTIWHFNNLGYRERPIQINKPEGTLRIVVIGDSIVMGFGVEDFETFTRKLEQILKPEKVKTGITHFEVVNFGIQGYSTPQYLALLKEDVLKTKPDLVIVSIYLSNDLLEAVGVKKNTTYSLLKSIPDLIPLSLSETLKTNSKLYLFLLTKYYTFIEKFGSKDSVTSKDEDYGWEIISNDIKEIKRITQNNSIKFVLVGIPNPRQVVTSEPSKDQDRLFKLTKDLNIIYYNPLEDLRGYKTPKNLYLDDLDDHFSVIGNEYFSSLLSKFLWDNKLIPEQPKTNSSQ